MRIQLVFVADNRNIYARQGDIMREFMLLIGQIILISCVQTLTELFIDKDNRPYTSRLVNVACFAGSFYLLLQFVFNYLLGEITTVVNFPL